MAIIGSSRGLIPFAEIPIRPKLGTVTGFLGGKRRTDDEEMALESGNRQRKQQKQDKQPQQVEQQEQQASERQARIVPVEDENKAESKIEISSRVPSEQEQLQMQQQAKALNDEFTRHFQEKQRRFGEEFNEFMEGGVLDPQRDLHLRQIQQQQEREQQRRQDAQEIQGALKRQGDEQNLRDIRRGLLGR